MKWIADCQILVVAIDECFLSNYFRTSDGYTEDPIGNGNITNGGKNFKVGFDELQEQTTSMPAPRSPSRKGYDTIFLLEFSSFVSEK